MRRHEREGALNGLGHLADNPPNSLEYFQALRGFKSLFPLLEKPEVVALIPSTFSFHAAVHILGEMFDPHGHPIDCRTELVQVHVRLDLLGNPWVAVPENSLGIHEVHARGLQQ
jgi:hypothetical protein